MSIDFWRSTSILVYLLKHRHFNHTNFKRKHFFKAAMNTARHGLSRPCLSAEYLNEVNVDKPFCTIIALLSPQVLCRALSIFIQQSTNALCAIRMKNNMLISEISAFWECCGKTLLGVGVFTPDRKKRRKVSEFFTLSFFINII